MLRHLPFYSVFGLMAFTFALLAHQPLLFKQHTPVFIESKLDLATQNTNAQIASKTVCKFELTQSVTCVDLDQSWLPLGPDYPFEYDGILSTQWPDRSRLADHSILIAYQQFKSTLSFASISLNNR